MYISTEFSNEIVLNQNKRGQPKKKPLPMAELYMCECYRSFGSNGSVLYLCEENVHMQRQIKTNFLCNTQIRHAHLRTNLGALCSWRTSGVIQKKSQINKLLHIVGLTMISNTN